MAILIVIALISFSCFMVATDIVDNQKTLRSFVSMCLSGAILVVSLSALLFSKEFVVDDANAVATIVLEEKNKNNPEDKLYYDAEHEKYFILKYHYLNPLNPISRRYIETKQAEVYVEVYNELIKIKLN